MRSTVLNDGSLRSGRRGAHLSLFGRASLVLFVTLGLSFACSEAERFEPDAARPVTPQVPIAPPLDQSLAGGAGGSGGAAGSGGGAGGGGGGAAGAAGAGGGAGPIDGTPRECEERERCDPDAETALDEDCDGRVDEACPCRNAEQLCFSGDPRSLGFEQATCRPGSQACLQETYGACEGEVLPSEERCDGLDNDCDGITDEDSADEGCENTPPTVTCTPPQRGAPLRRYQLSGEYADADGDVLRRAVWRFLSTPPGSGSALEPPDQLSTSFFADLQGVYTLELEVEDERGAIGRCQTSVTTQSADQLRIEVVWNANQLNDPSDIDMHLIRPGPGRLWFNLQEDCYYRNCSVCQGFDEQGCREFLASFPPDVSPDPVLAWSQPLDGDDPRLDLDDVEGNGPENINILTPRDGRYRLGIHYYDDDRSGPATVSVRVFCRNELVTSLEPVTLNANSVSPTNDFWEVGDINWRNGSCEVELFGEPGCRQICQTQQAENGGCPSGQSRGAVCP